LVVWGWSGLKRLQRHGALNLLPSLEAAVVLALLSTLY
jgi:hypothetical protein